jgi:2,3-bisphosphoglycerate-dependent phosphoglycerate mutase
VSADLLRFVLVRHGESEFNAENRFTGWLDCPLTAAGVEEARRAGISIRNAGFRFDRIYSSVLVRATESARIIREDLGQPDVPIVTSWRLNERHYGALQGLNKAETAARFGVRQVSLWRRSYDVRPPALDQRDILHLEDDPRYAHVPPDEIPLSESLADTVRRVLPYWEAELAPAIRSGQSILIVAHGNSIRALVKYLDDMSDEAVVGLNIPTGVPQVYELDRDMRPLRHYYLDAGR